MGQIYQDIGKTPNEKPPAATVEGFTSLKLITAY